MTLRSVRTHAPVGWCVVAATLVAPIEATAQDPAAAPAPPAPRPPTAAADPSDAGDSALPSSGEVIVVEEIVRGPLSSAEMLTSVDLVDGDELAHTTVDEPLELLGRVPALYVSDYNQGVVGAGIGMRGFNTENEVAHVKLLVDGIPSNLHTGEPELKWLFPIEIRRIEVVKGTNDPRYGLNNVAGNVNVVTKEGGDDAIARVQGGSFGTFDVQGLAASESGAFAQTYVIGYRHGEGFRPGATNDRAGGAGKWFYQAGPWRVGAIARGVYVDSDAPGYLTAEASATTPGARVAHAADDGGVQRALHGSVHADRPLGARGSLSLKAYVQDLERSRWVRFDAEAGQQERHEREGQAGMIGSVTYRDDALGPLTAVAVEWGADVQLQGNRHRRYATVARDRMGTPTRDHDFELLSAGTYVHAMGNPHRLLKLVTGIRLDRLGGSFENRADGATYDINDYGTIVQPKLGLLVMPAAGHLLYSNYGRTFQVGVGIGAFATQEDALRPSINDGWEAGYRVQLDGWLSGRLAYWQQQASGEVRLKYDDSGEAENIGETLRRGVDVELAVQPHARVAAWLAVGWHTSRQVEPGPAFPGRRRKEIDHIPDYTAKGGIDVEVLRGLVASAGVAAQGDYYLTKENDAGQYGAHVLVSADVVYDLWPWLQVGLHGRNLLDARYDSYVWYKDFGVVGTQHNPGDPLAVYASATARR